MKKNNKTSQPQTKFTGPYKKKIIPIFMIYYTLGQFWKWFILSKSSMQS